jgi:hypothetical protein
VKSGWGWPSVSTWKLANGTGFFSSLMSTSHRNEGGPCFSLATSSSATSMTFRPWSGNGTGSAV